MAGNRYSACARCNNCCCRFVFPVLRLVHHVSSPSFPPPCLLLNAALARENRSAMEDFEAVTQRLRSVEEAHENEADALESRVEKAEVSAVYLYQDV